MDGDLKRSTDQVATIVQRGRAAILWSQRELSRRSSVPQSRISLIERARADLRLSELDRLCAALGVRYWFGAELMNVLGPRVSDAVHSRCSAYVQRRMVAKTWAVQREVEVGGGRYRGWIDLL